MLHQAVGTIQDETRGCVSTSDVWNLEAACRIILLTSTDIADARVGNVYSHDDASGQSIVRTRSNEDNDHVEALNQLSTLGPERSRTANPVRTSNTLGDRGGPDPIRHRTGNDWQIHETSKDVTVGMSRLHMVSIPALQMKPIYWSPVNDVAVVTRGTWFYRYVDPITRSKSPRRAKVM